MWTLNKTFRIYLLFGIIISGCSAQSTSRTPDITLEAAEPSSTPAESPTPRTKSTLIAVLNTETPIASQTPFAPIDTSTPVPSLTPDASPTVDAQTAARQQLDADFANFKLDETAYKIGFDKDGKIQAFDKSKKLIYWDGKWAVNEIGKIIANSGDCYPTKYPKAPGMEDTTKQFHDEFWQEIFTLFDDLIANKFTEIHGASYNLGLFPEYIMPVSNCWGFRYGSSPDAPSTNYLYRDKSGKWNVSSVFDN